uniref:Golgi apparatus membrane protein TVP23 n=1 Tax=Tetradesmus obliquus TaxID=3088 RepID=A0A383VP63_TETOB|eukprot:jgi/Sobl393_1/11543/SZX66961.1
MSTPVQLVPPPIAAEPPAPKHPFAFIFHFAFKVAAMVFYLLCETFNKNQFVLNFVVCIVLLAMDFWTVKNVTGRLLVGLRWWNEGNSETGNAWRFESLAEGQRVINPYESRWFWIVLVANPALWVLCSLSALLGLDWGYLLIPITGVVLGGSNLAGYFKCSKDAKKQLQSMTANMATSAMTSAMTGRLQAAIARV